MPTNPTDGQEVQTIRLECAVCGNTVIVERDEIDPPNAVLCKTNECDKCHAANGGFGESWYYDADGKEILDDPKTWMKDAEIAGTHG